MNQKETLKKAIADAKETVNMFARAASESARYAKLHQDSVKALEQELEELEEKERPPKELWANEYRDGSRIPAFHLSEDQARQNATPSALRVAVLYREVKE